MNEHIKKLVSIVNKHSPKMFINSNFELIIEPKYNIYLLLSDIEDEVILKCKVISWLSRSACRENEYGKYAITIKNIFNEVLEYQFTNEQIEIMYSNYGMSHDYEKIKRFIESDYKSVK